MRILLEIAESDGVRFHRDPPGLGLPAGADSSIARTLQRSPV